MISVEEALERILSHFRVLEPEEKPLLETLGQVLAEDVYSPFDVPPLDNAAMDGYALQAASIAGASESSPAVLEVIGEVAAGYQAQQTVRPGTAIRIMTGAPLPEGADTVVPFEDTDEVAQKAAGAKQIERIGVLKLNRKGANIRKGGEDIRRGELVVKAGTVLRPSEIGVLASLGKDKLRVIRRPKVAILATGDELVDIGNPLPFGKIYNSNTYSVASLVLRYGGMPKVLGIARDTVEALMEKIDAGLDADMFITSAGVSMGDYDMVKNVLAARGEIDFWTVRMKPGKPLAFGVLDGGNGRKVPLLGLPGNPVSSVIAFEQFGRLSILKMLGKRNFVKPTIEAISESRIDNRDGRRVFARAIITRRNGTYYASLTGPQGSGILTSMAAANGLAIVPEEVPLIKEGETVKVQMLDWNEEQG